MVAATFLPVALALVALLLPEVRSRALWGLGLVGAAVVMVGLHPVSDPVPLGALLAEAFAASPTLSGFRSTYKAGAGLVLSIAVLVGLGVDAVAARAGRRSSRGTALRVAAVGVVLLSGLPFWVGDLYDPDATSGPIPEYWDEAAAAVNDLPGDGRLLVLPSSTRAIYEWGWVGDDIVDSLITRPQASDVTIPLSTPEAADLLAALSQGVDDARYREGSLAPILRRLGIDHVLVRNDLDTAATRTLAPDRMTELRFDPGLEQVATFGPPGFGADRGPGLPALELYAVVDPGPTGPRLAPVERPVVVSGSPAALPMLAAEGILDDAGPVRFGPDLDDAELVAALDDDDGRVVLTDTNRRRVTVVNSLVRDESWTLAQDEDLDREGAALFEEPGSQTVAWYPDATEISSSGFPRTADGGQPWTRPAMAFDGDPDTAWQTVELADHEGTTLRVELREPRPLGRMVLAPVETTGSAPRATEVEVTSSDGSRTTVDLSEGEAEVDLGAGPSTWFEVEITEVTGNALGPVGFTEVAVEGLDLQEWVQMPDDLVRRGLDDPALGAALEAAPLTITMERDRPEAPFPVEPALRRRFRLDSERSLDLVAEVTPTTEGDVGDPGRAGRRRATTPSSRWTARAGRPHAGRSRRRDRARGRRPGSSPAPRSGWPPAGTSWRPATPGSTTWSSTTARRPTPSVEAPPGGVEVLEAGPDSQHLRVDAPEGGVLVTGQSWDDRWVATVDGTDLGPAAPYDTLGGWELPPARTWTCTSIWPRPGGTGWPFSSPWPARWHAWCWWPAAGGGRADRRGRGPSGPPPTKEVARAEKHRDGCPPRRQPRRTPGRDRPRWAKRRSGLGDALQLEHAVPRDDLAQPGHGEDPPLAGPVARGGRGQAQARPGPDLGQHPTHVGRPQLHVGDVHPGLAEEAAPQAQPPVGTEHVQRDDLVSAPRRVPVRPADPSPPARAQHALQLGEDRDRSRACARAGSSSTHRRRTHRGRAGGWRRRGAHRAAAPRWRPAWPRPCPRGRPRPRPPAWRGCRSRARTPGRAPVDPRTGGRTGRPSVAARAR